MITNEKIGEVASIKIKDNGMIANISLDNTRRNEIMFHLFAFEDRIFFLEFKVIGLSEMIKEIDEKNLPYLVKTLEISKKKMEKEIRGLKRTMNKIAKLL